MTTTTESKILAIVADQACVSIAEVKPECRFAEDLNLDSLDVVEMVMTFESEFNLEFDTDDDAFEKLLTVENLIDYAEKRLKEEVEV
jgi:acyl carrier protein